MSQNIILYTLLSVFLVSIVSLIGIVTISIRTTKLKKWLIYLISFAAGALLGDTFIHLIPEIAQNGLALSTSLLILLGILLFFILEKGIHWQHCHEPISKKHMHPFAYTNLIGDGLHNFIDGAIIAASYIVSIPAGIATTIAVLLHEIPQEIGDFAVLIHAGFTKPKALALNFLSAIIAFIGAFIVFWLGSTFTDIEKILIPIAAGGFLYIASSDLIPEIHKHSSKLSQSLLQLLFFIIGILVMATLLLLE